jgi:type III pantothenate kinase
MHLPNIHFGVDIGNSGLRVTRFELPGMLRGEPYRVNWLHSSSSPASTRSVPSMHTRAADTRQTRFPPDSDAWFEALSHWIDHSVGRAVSGSGASGLDRPPAGCVWHVSSVRQDAFERLRQFVNERADDVLHVIRYTDVPMKVGVDRPERLGIDRLLAAFAACQSSPQRPLLVIQAGSAVTVDLVEHHAGQDCFAGGAILPGVPMMLRLLGQAADMLPELDADDLTALPDLPGRNTEAAMLCGTASCLVGGIQHLVTRFRELHGAQTPVVISGGDGVRLLPNIPSPVSIVPDLVLLGVQEIAARYSSTR